MNKEQSESKIETLKNKIEMLQSNTSLSSGAQDLVKLLNLANTDEDVATRLDELGTTSKAELIAYGKEKGFNFTEEDIDTINNELFGASDELSGDELEQVAGGTEQRTVLAVSLVWASAIAVTSLVGSRPR